ncbi:MAG: secretin N-terminal domain-containing protein [Neisseriaceae bacterium]
MKKLLIILLVQYSIVFADNVTQPNNTTSTTSTDKTNTNSYSGNYNYFFRQESLKSVLSKFAKSNGVRVVFSSTLGQVKLNSLVSGRFSGNRTEDLLNTLANQYGFAWFFYSGTLYITSLAQTTVTIPVSSTEMPMIRDNLMQLGLLSRQFGYTELSTENKIVITGPREYINLIKKQIGGLNVAPRDQQFAIFHLKYASATDTNLSYNNQQIVIPGVATVLRQLLRAGGSSSGLLRSPIKGNVITPLNNAANLANGESEASNGSSSSSNSSNSQASLSSPIIQADSRLNTIIIMDKSSNLKLYKNLIQQLDVPAPLIQIEVLIVHLDQNKLNDAGINWWLSGGQAGGGIGFGAANLSNPTNNLALSYNQVNPGQLVIGSLPSFSASLQFLETKRFANVTSKPSLVTIDNIPAIVSSIENLYIAQNIPGNNTSNPNNISNANQIQLTQSLEITPHIIYNDNGEKDIKLSIVLQDGAIDQSRETVIPGSIQSTLNSQAVIPVGKSLVLAGYTKDSIIRNERKVPILGDIPLLGWFFKSSSAENHKITTLYLVTPRLVTQEKLASINKYIDVDGKKINAQSETVIRPLPDNKDDKAKK